MEDAVTEPARNSEELYRSAIVWDMIMPWRKMGSPALRAQMMPRLRRAGVSHISLTVANDSQTIDETIRLIAAERRSFALAQDDYVLVETVDDIEAAKAAGKLAVSFHFQGTNALTASLGMVDVYRRLGVRHMLLAFNTRNHVGDGCHEVTNSGLSAFGRQLIAEMERVGVLVDLSHVGRQSTLDVFDRISKPVIFSHSNPKALFDHPRNIDDKQIRLCAQSGGVIGVNGMGTFIRGNVATPEALADICSYVADLVGPEHVGLGLDYVYDWPGMHAEFNAGKTNIHPEGQGYDDPNISFAPHESIPALVDLLIGRGFSDADIRGVLGQNWMRVARATWK